MRKLMRKARRTMEFGEKPAEGGFKKGIYILIQDYIYILNFIIFNMANYYFSGISFSIYEFKMLKIKDKNFKFLKEILDMI